MIEKLKIILPNGDEIAHNFAFSEQGTLQFARLKIAELERIDLDYFKCKFCELSENEYSVCPAAEIISYYTKILSHIKSFKLIDIEYTRNIEPDKIIKRQIRAQDLAVEFMKIAIFQTQCPVGRKLKTFIMKIPAFVNDQKLLNEVKEFFNEDNKHLLKIYLEVFENMIKRFTNKGEEDAKMNGFVNLHTLMQSIQFDLM